MKRVMSMLFLFLPLIILGCSQNEESFDHTALKEELKEEGITPKLPTKFPMTIVEYERAIPPHETDIHEVIFKGEEGGMKFSLTIQPPPVEYINLEKEEEVTVNGNNGFFIQGPGPSIHWTDGDYHYILTYYGEKATKETMVGIAESFQ
ncbi:hypothetical protein [Bacillus sp. FJAT-27251]|uniref:hypothetical protein n=1 Tax=Bacillus sp. FJAT-27251 TaxID=1684142 RepID=UPI0006A7A2E3|nr:hypothetical protein [Bacillus sp. FJAT-27251]